MQRLTTIGRAHYAVSRVGPSGIETGSSPPIDEPERLAMGIETDLDGLEAEERRRSVIFSGSR
jgi:hypothetical protein